MRQRLLAEKPRAVGCRVRMYSAKASTVPCPQPSAAILRLMCSPMFQYRSISSLLTAATARLRAASIRRSTSSKSAADGVVKAVVRDRTFLGLAIRHLLGLLQAYHCPPP